MSRKTRRDLLAEQLDAKQQKAAYVLLDNEMLSTSEQRTQDEIAEELGVSRITLWRWRKQNQAFIEFKKEVARDYLGDGVGTFASALMKSMQGAQPSQKALDLFAKMMGFIKNEHSVEVTSGGAKTDEDMKAELALLSQELAELDDENGGDE